MIKGIGIDIIEIKRIERLFYKTDRFIERILTSNERIQFNKIQTNRRKVEFLAGRFAAKEAFAKATGMGIGELSFQHIEVRNSTSGAPFIIVEGYETKNVLLSISHSKEYAVAQVIIEEK